MRDLLENRGLATVEEYLATSFSPDCDYVDGIIEDRNLGEFDHARLQTRIAIYFGKRERELGLWVLVEQRVQVTPSRFRVPDVCVVVGERPKEQIFQKPPFLCLEILSPEDRMPRMQVRLNDYLRAGVPYVFLLDPQMRKACRWTAEGMREVTELRMENPEIVAPLGELFE